MLLLLVLPGGLNCSKQAWQLTGYSAVDRYKRCNSSPSSTNFSLAHCYSICSSVPPFPLSIIVRLLLFFCTYLVKASNQGYLLHIR